MKGDDSQRSGTKITGPRRNSASLSTPIHGWRQNSITITTLAQQSAYWAEKAFNEANEENVSGNPVSFVSLFKFVTPYEVALLLVAILLATINGLFVPMGIIIYGEFTSLLIDRTVMNGTSSPTFAISLFGGGEILTNASPETNRLALIKDSQAFGIGCIVFSFIQFIVGAISVDTFNYIALRQMDRVKESFLRAVLRQDLTWYDLNTSMNFATKVSDDLEKIREGIGEKVPILVYLIMSFVTAVIISFFYGWELTAVILSVTPVVIATTAIVAKIQSSLTSQELKAYSTAGVIAEEVLSSIRTVVAFGGEEKEIKRYSEQLAPAKKTGMKKGMYSGLGSALMWFMIYATYSLGFWYGVDLILDSREEEKPMYTPAVLMIIFFSILQGAQNVGLTSPHMEAISSARASAGTIFEIIDRKSVIDSLTTEGQRPELQGDLELSNIFFKYPARSDVQVLNGLSLKINFNETIALVGPSGCGKSTVLQLIQRLYDPDSGTVTVSGYDLKDLNVKHYRSHIAVVGQEPVLFAGSIKDNIRMSNPTCSDEDIISAAKQAYCHHIIKALPEGYNTMLGERGAQLSGGQKQRIAIARALIRKPKILILDEATSALDSQSEAKVQKALDSASQGRTTIMVSHRLATVLNATRVVFIDKGEIVEMGTHVELINKKGRYYNLVLENDPSLAQHNKPQAETIKHAKIQKPKQKVLSMESLKSNSSESSTSESSDEKKVKELPEHKVTTWQILKMSKPEKWLMVIGVLGAIAVGASFPMFAILFGETYGLLESSDANYVRSETNLIAIYFLIVGIFTGVGIFIQIYVFNLAGVKLTARLRVASFKAMLKQEIGWFDQPVNGVGALCSKLAADAAAVQGASGARVGALMQAFSTMLIGILLSLYYTWKMTLVSLISLPLVIGAVVLESRVLAAGLIEMRKSCDKATTIATEGIANIKTVAAMCGEEGILERYKVAGNQARITSRKGIRWRGSVYTWGQTAPVAGYALSLWYGGIMVANKEVHYEDVIKVSEALVFGAWMMGQALAFAPNFGAAISAAGRVVALLERKTLIESTHAPAVPENFVVSGKITYKNIKFRYPTRLEVQVLKGLNLSIPNGKRVALVGPSGCGKSTLIQVLQRLYDVDEGNVYLDDYDIVSDMRLTTLRRNLGLVSQEPVLFDRTIAENIAYGDNTREVTIEEIVQASQQANVHAFVAALPKGYDTRIGARASQLSGGQKQRIAIARALVRNPRVLLLDEATSALDTHSEKVVQEALDKASFGRTCLIIAHRLATIRNADIICVIDGGVVAELGSHEDLIAMKGIYAKLYELQCGAIDETNENSTSTANFTQDSESISRENLN